MACQCNCGNNIQKFSDKTTIHGFLELYYAKSIFWKIIWFLVIVGAISISIFQLTKLAKSTIEEPTTSIIRPLTSEIKYPPLSICYVHWVFWVNWTIVSDLGFDKHSALYGLGFLSDIKSSKWFNLTEAKEKFVETMKRNHFTRLSQFYSAIAYDRPHGFELNILTFNKILDVQSWLFCYTASSEMIKIELQTRPGLNQITFKYASNYFFPDERYVTNQEYNAYILERLQGESSEDISLAQLNFSKIRVSPKINVDNTDAGWIMVEENTYAVHVMITSTLNVWLNNGNPECDDDENTDEVKRSCLRFCQWIAYADRYPNNCLHLYGASLLGIDTIEKVCKRNVEFLDENIQMKINRKDEVSISRIYPNDSCIAKFCMLPCRDWKYTSIFNTESIPLQLSFVSLNTKFTISYPSGTSVLEITQVPSQTWESIIGNVGGIVGLWLGASVISLLQMVYLCCGDCSMPHANFKWGSAERKIHNKFP